MPHLKKLSSAKRFLRADQGATAIEYAMIAALVIIAIVAAVTLLGTGVGNLFTKVQAAF